MDSVPNKIELHKIHLLDKRAENATTHTFMFDAPDDLVWSEGANIHLGNSKFDLKKGKDNKDNVRHLSIMSLAEEGVIAVTTRIPKPCSEYKKTLRNSTFGDTFVAFKLTNHMALRRHEKPIILLSAGVAIATMRPLIRAYSNSNKGIESMTHINIDSSREYIFEEELTWSAQTTNGLQNFYVSTRGEYYESLNSKFNNDAFYYIVGSDSFVIETSKGLLSKGIPVDSLVLDKPESFYQNVI